MKILASSDWHISNSNNNFPMSNNVSLLLEHQEMALEDFTHEWRTGTYDLCVIAGDLVDRSRLAPAELQVLARFLTNMAIATKQLNESREDPAYVFILTGNHGYSDSKGGFTPVASMQSLVEAITPYVIIAKHRDHYSININDQEYTIVTVPYSKNYQSIEEWLTHLNTVYGASVNHPKMIGLGHFPTTNGILDNNFKSENGVTLTPEMVINFEIFLLGDFHKHQKLAGFDNVYYVGSPFDLKFNENMERGWYCFELKDGISVKQLINPYQIPLITASDVNELARLNPYGAILRYTGSSDRDTKAAIREMGWKNVVFKETRKTVKKTTANIVEISSSQNDRDLIQSFIGVRDRFIDFCLGQMEYER